MPEIDPILRSDAELLGRCRDGDDRAFRRLVDRYHDALYAVAFGMLGAHSDSVSVVQDCFVRFYQNLEKFEGRSTLKTYLTRIVMNQALKQIRQRQRWYYRFLSSDDPDIAVGESREESGIVGIEEEERAVRIRAAVQGLAPEFRSVVVLRFLNGCSTQECSTILKIPAGTVMSRLSRALDKLAPMLKDLNSQLPCP